MYFKNYCKLTGKKFLESKMSLPTPRDCSLMEVDERDTDLTSLDEHIEIDQLKKSMASLWPLVKNFRFIDKNMAPRLLCMMRHYGNVDGFTIARYECVDLKYFSRDFKTVHLLLNYEFRTLKGDSFIHGSVIDSFMSQKRSSGEWKNVHFFSTTLTLYILGDGFLSKKVEDFIGYNIQINFTGKLFLPYSYKHHWCLIILDFNSKTVMHYDPLHSANSEERISRVLSYLEQGKKINRSNSNLFTVQWNPVESFGTCLTQKDGHNCGSYVMYAMNSVAQNLGYYEMSLFEPNEFRVKVALDLLRYSSPLDQTCLGCVNTQNTNFDYQCRNCLRFVHSKCFQMFFSNSSTCKVCEKMPQEQDLSRNIDTIFGIDTENFYGFPNPLNSNSCWLNSVLQGILLLPIFNELDRWNFLKRSNLLSSLKEIQTARPSSIEQKLK